MLFAFHELRFKFSSQLKATSERVNWHLWISVYVLVIISAHSNHTRDGIMGTKKGIWRCICSQPFTLYSFPTERKDPATRRRWIQLLNRKGEGKQTNWPQKQSSRVCSLHFPDGHPTLANPYPTLLLGYATASSATRTRKPPSKRKASNSITQSNQ